jgi:hypothetical protein
VPQPQTAETPDRLEVASPLHAALRFALVAMAVVPLLAPYELLVRTAWRDLTSPFFVVAVLVSAGAVLVSGLLLFAALAGTSSRVVLDRRAGTASFTSWAPAVPRATRVLALRDVVGVEVGARDWSDGGQSYHVRLVVADGSVWVTGSSASRDDADAIRARLVGFLAGPVPPRPHG